MYTHVFRRSNSWKNCSWQLLIDYFATKYNTISFAHCRNHRSQSLNLFLRRFRYSPYTALMNSPCKTTQNKTKGKRKRKKWGSRKKGNKPNSIFFYAVFTQHKILLNKSIIIIFSVVGSRFVDIRYWPSVKSRWRDIAWRNFFCVFIQPDAMQVKNKTTQKQRQPTKNKNSFKIFRRLPYLEYASNIRLSIRCYIFDWKRGWSMVYLPGPGCIKPALKCSLT